MLRLCAQTDECAAVFRASQPGLHDAARGDSVSGMKERHCLPCADRFRAESVAPNTRFGGSRGVGRGRAAAGPFRQGSARQVELI